MGKVQLPSKLQKNVDVTVISTCENRREEIKNSIKTIYFVTKDNLLFKCKKTLLFTTTERNRAGTRLPWKQGLQDFFARDFIQSPTKATSSIKRLCSHFVAMMSDGSTDKVK